MAYDLREMLTYRRPLTSPTLREFTKRYLEPLPGAWEDTHGNYHVQVGESPRVLWSCHTDTVHSSGGRQKVEQWGGRILSLPLKSASNCLGADDTVGVWLCCEMIARNIPGRYIFHYGEERGGIGSSALARKNPDWISQTPIAIALDRAGYTDIITHQAGMRTASEAFAVSLGSQLGMDYRACDGGVYTDTAEYADIIPECTNLSVGYARQHSSAEETDAYHAEKLLDRLCEMDQSALVVARDPATAYDYEDDDEDELTLIGLHRMTDDEWSDWLSRWEDDKKRYGRM